MHWFGPARGIDLASTLKHVPAPIGRPCQHCGEPIRDLESGVMLIHVDSAGRVGPEPWHIECHLRSIVGGVNHQCGRCCCCGGTEDPDPPGLTAHEAAIAAAEHFWENQG